ncbi:MAG: DUF4097 family beta strand repeat-containing protein [Candidatus Aminicenantes bacterium]|nr:DUF4097 family beta strand repeat-containing protein [Candidatus Aminicenantes bacterium]
MTRAKILVILSVFVFLLAGSTAALADYREDFSKTLPLKAGERFSLGNVNGGVIVSTWKEDKVEIKAVKIARDDEKDLKDVEIRVDQSAGMVSVKAIWPKYRRHFNVNVDFEIKVPEGVILDEVETVNGGVEIAGRYGRAAVGTTNGSVSVEDASGELKAYTTNGGIQVNHFEGKLQAETTNGNIRLEGLTFKDGLTAETTNGSITLAIASPDALNADLLARTTNGHITVDFPVTLKNLTQSKHRVEAKIGQGGPEISLETTNGSIRLTK